MRKLSFVFLVVCLFAFSASAFGQNVVKNGTFESPHANDGSWSTFFAGQTFANWTVGGGSVDLHNGEGGAEWKFAVAGGHQAVDLTGGGQSSISQDLPTTPGHYKLRFDMAGNMACDPGPRQLRVNIGGYSFTETYSYGGTSFTMPWVEHSYEVDLSGPTTLTFQSLSGNGCGPAIDNVFVSRIPTTLGRTNWQMYRNPIITSGVTNYGTHGNINYYQYAPAIPPVDATTPLDGQGNGGWTPAPNGDHIAFGNNGASRLSGVGGCLTSLDFTFFQTLVDIPAAGNLTSFTISFNGMDDGSRVSIINSKYPLGLVIPDSYVTLSNAATSDLKSYIVIGETNRVVITQMDDCPVGNQLDSAVVVLNGDVVAPTPPPSFSRLLNPPAGSCICTPLLMNSDVNGTQSWWVKALGGNLSITAIAHAVNSFDAEMLIARIYDPGGILVNTLTASYPAGQSQGAEIPASTTVNAAAGSVYRVDIATPNTPGTQPHYRLKFEGADAAGTNSPSSPSFEHDEATWYFNTAVNEALNVRVFVTGTPSSAATLNYDLTAPNGATVSGTVSATTSTDGTISSSLNLGGGTWLVHVKSATDHYGLDKTGGADRGVYVGWKSGGAGNLTLKAVTSPNGPIFNAAPVTFTVKASTGAILGNYVSNGIPVDLLKLPVGTYTVSISPLADWTSSPSTMNVDVYCDKVTTSQFVMSPISRVTVSSASGTYGGTTSLSASLTSGGAPLVGQTINFSLNGISVGSAVTGAGGFANLPAASLLGINVGSYSSGVLANFVGIPNVYPSASASNQLTVNKAPTSTSVTATPPFSVYGQSVTFTATVTSPTGGVPTGSVNFTISGFGGGTFNVTLDATGHASFTTSGLEVGGHNTTAAYQGSPNYNTSSGQTGQTVGPYQPPVTVTSNFNPSGYGLPVTFTASVDTLGGSPQGSFLFYDGTTSTPLTGGPISVSVAGTHGSASFSTNNLAPGAHTILTVYNPTTNRFLSNTGSMVETINPPAAIPFSQILPSPAGSCICTPDVMNTTAQGSQHWFAYASGTSMTATVFGISVNSMEPGAVVMKIFDAAGTTQIGSAVSVSYPAGTAPGGETSASATFSTTPNTVYRFVISTPASPMQPHYRLKWDGAAEAGMASPGVNALEEVEGDLTDVQRWYMNADNNEQLNFAIFQPAFMFGIAPGAPAPGVATTATVRVFNVAVPGVPVPLIDPNTHATVTSVHLTLPGPGGIQTAAPLPAGIYAIVLSDVNGHFRMSKGSGSDKGIYVGWDTGNQGIVKITVAPGNVPFSGKVQITVASPLTGDVVAGGDVGVEGFEDGADVGHYHLEFTAPAGYTVVPSSMDIDITCDKLTKIDLKIYAVTTTNVTAPTITYNGNSTVTVAVDSQAGTVSGNVTLTVDGGSPQTLALSGGAANFNVGVLHAGDHALVATYTDPTTDGRFLDSSNTGTLTVEKADSTVTVTCSNVTYSTLAQTPCAAEVNGVGGLYQILTPTYSSNINAGPVTASASFAGDTNHNGSTGSATFDIAKAGSVTIVTCPASVVYTGLAQTPCSSTTTGVGLSLTLTPSYSSNVNVGPATASVNFIGDPNHTGSSNSKTFSILQAATGTTIITSVNPSLLGQSVTFTAKVSSAAVGPMTGTVTFTDGSAVLGMVSVSPTGVAVFQTSTLVVGSHPIVATYSGDINHIGSASTPLNQIVYAFAGTGAFVIGDKNAIVGNTVTFWDAQWEKKNSLSGPMANASFKGFANAVDTAAGTWRTDPGDSSNPPASIPEYMGLIVASTDVKSGSTISGNIVKIVVVKTNAGFDANPGHAGTGTIIP